MLVAEDNAKLSSALKKGLEQEGYAVDCAADGREAEALVKRFARAYDLIVLDIMLPGRDGFTVCRNIREAGITVPILALTARDSVEDRVAGLDAGADDYLVKPFAFEELKARLRALARRPRESKPGVLRSGDISLDRATLKVTAGSREVPLTRTEFGVLEMMMRHPGQVLSRDQIVSRLWRFDADPGSNAVDVHVKNLRKKLIEAGHADVIETVRGVGYRFRKG